MALNNDNLPDFVDFGRPRRYATIVDSGKDYTIVGEGYNVPHRFDTVVAAYDFIRDELGCEAHWEPGSLNRERPEDEDAHPFYFGPAGEDGTGRLLMSYQPEFARESVQESYREFLDAYATWRQTPSDFYAAYDFLNRHPAFWSANDIGGETHWECDFGMGHDAPSVYKDDNGRVRVLLEVGPYVAPDYTQHSIDTRLVTAEPNYELAVIFLASKVHHYYDETGADRPDVPEWEQDRDYKDGPLGE